MVDTAGGRSPTRMVELFEKRVVVQTHEASPMCLSIVADEGSPRSYDSPSTSVTVALPPPTAGCTSTVTVVAPSPKEAVWSAPAAGSLFRSVGPPAMWNVTSRGPDVSVRSRVNDPGSVVGSLWHPSTSNIGVVAEIRTTVV